MTAVEVARRADALIKSLHPWKSSAGLHQQLSMALNLPSSPTDAASGQWRGHAP